MAVSFLMGLAALRERLSAEVRARAAERNVSLYFLENVEAGKPSVIPSLFLLVFDQDVHVAQQAATAIGRLTAHFSMPDWRRLETHLRSSLVGLTTVKPQHLPLLARFGARQGLLLGLASFVRDGYVREAAVKELAGRSDGELPFLLMRLNDWVPRVAESALAACKARFTPDYAVAYLANLPYVLALEGAERHDFGPFLRDFRAFLMRPECRTALQDGLNSPDALIRRTCFFLVLSSAAGHKAHSFFQLAFQSPDPIVRRQAAQLLRGRPDGDAVQIALLVSMARHPLAAIRREYLFLCQEKYPDRMPEALRNALLDSHPSVRALARFYLPRYGFTDFRRFYLDGLETGDQAVALAGLGETGRAEDAGLVRTYLSHPVTAVRQMAVTALGRLDGDAALPQLLDALNDSRARVSRAACAALRPFVHRIDDEALGRAYRAGTTPHAWRNALRLMLALTKWRGGVLLIEACVWNRTDIAEARAGMAMEFLERWLGRLNESFLRPTRQQLSRFRWATEEGASAFDAETLARLCVVLRREEELAA